MSCKNVFLIVGLLLSSSISATQTEESNEIRYSQGEVSDTRSALIQRWHLNEEEAARYIEIMQGPLGRWNENMDPIMALGIFARSEVEQLKYAEIYARNEHALLTKTQAFERAYRDAFRRLFPESEIISSELMQAYYAHQEQKKNHPLLNPVLAPFIEGDRVLYFADMNCPDCSAEVSKLQALLAKYRDLSVDIYVRNIRDESEARAWAKRYRVSIDLIRASRMTINLDDGVYSRMSKQSEKASRFYLSRGEGFYSLEAKDLLSK